MKRVIFYSVPVILGLVLFAENTASDLYKRAPDVFPGTLREMRNVSYWVAKIEKPDEVFLTPEAIQDMNERYDANIRAADSLKNIPPERFIPEERLNQWPGRFLVKPDISSMKPDSIAVIVKREIRKCADFLRLRPYGNFQGIEYSDRDLAGLDSEMALDLVLNEVVTRDGITVCTTRLRAVPSFFPAQTGQMSETVCYDLWNISLLRIGSHVIVLHSSRSGSYVFVLSDEGFGWVESKDVAFGHIVEIREYSDSKRFAVCTGDRVPYYTDKRCLYASGWLRMGDRVPFAEGDSARVILVPVRSINGKFRTETAWLREDADISIGWLPYTRRNIVRTAFKLLDTPYDWTTAYLGRSHETIYRDIFACFGFRLPFHCSLFSLYGDDETVLKPDTGLENQYKVILGHEPFVTIMSCGGHAMLLLGEHNGKPVVFDNNGYGYTGADGVEYQVQRCYIGDMKMPVYFLKSPITFLTVK